MNPVNYKTVFLVEARPFFTRKTSQQALEFDVIMKGKQAPTGVIPLSPISKSLWTCTVEAIQEYSRVVWDIFPNQAKVISYITYDQNSTTRLSGWSLGEQNLTNFSSCFAKASMNAFLNASPQNTVYDDSAIISGLQAAIDMLCVPTEYQEERRRNNLNIINKGRIILISNFKSDSQIKLIAEYLLDGIRKCNLNISSSNKQEKLPLSELNLVVINTFPINETSKITELPYHDISASTSCEVHAVKAGSYLSLKLMALVLGHYNLASTTVTGIPMKEEQNASSSANYDVELLHSNEAHLDLSDGLNIKSIKEGGQYETVSLKWCTPRTSSVDLHYCSGAFRVTSVDVNSRPSSCLTHFLLNGRTVLLEMPKVKGAKVMSHMLSSHNGEIYIHTLGTGRSILEDPPSISEGTGGRVTDYRINELGSLMKKNHLIRCKTIPVHGKDILPPIEKARLSLARQTLYWPMVIGHTIMFNIAAQIQPLIDLIPKEALTVDGDINECKKAIYQIVNMESKGMSIPIPSISSRGKGPKKEEQYKLLWREVEYYLSQYASSPEHKAVVTCLRELHVKPEAAKDANQTAVKPSSPPSGKKRELKEESEMAWKELDHYNELTEREKSDYNSEPTSKKPRLIQKPIVNPAPSISVSGPQSLLSLWLGKLESVSRRQNDFVGRAFGNIAPLYTNLNNEKHE